MVMEPLQDSSSGDAPQQRVLAVYAGSAVNQV